MDLKTIQDEMKASMKAKEPVKTGCLRMLISEIKKREIDRRETLSSDEILKVINSLIKQRMDSVEAFEKGGRTDLADVEKVEIAVLKAYLPEQLSCETIELLVSEAIEETQAKSAQDLGKVMKVVLAKVAGRADGKLVNETVKRKLLG